MEFLLFTYPNCSKCEGLKRYLNETALEWEEYNLVQKESKLKIREFLGILKRDDKGAIIIPTLLLQDEGEVRAVLNSRQELESWLKSKE
ncbi:MAG: hypothetical protein JSV96_10255 [Candidatus Aminicenantes bacterium]|nr:MAG: hypothetical protein JSV96_10255 [Candidatus Aminicenantes bacterium]